MPLERQQTILRLAMVRRIVRIRDLAKQLEVHEMTVRRDLDWLRVCWSAFTAGRG